MKHIFISLILAGGLYSASAQSDSVSTSTKPQRDTTPVTLTQNSMRSDSTASMNNTMRTDSSGSMNNTMKDTMNNMSNGTMNSMQNDSAHTMNNMNADSARTMTNNNMNSADSTRSVSNPSPGMNSNMQNNMNSNSSTNTNNMNSGMVTNSQNIEGQTGYASLPVLESYISADVVSKIKSKYPSVYDITAVKHTADQMGYVVRVSDNGTFKTETVGEDGNIIQ